MIFAPILPPVLPAEFFLFEPKLLFLPPTQLSSLTRMPFEQPGVPSIYSFQRYLGYALTIDVTLLSFSAPPSTYAWYHSTSPWSRLPLPLQKALYPVIAPNTPIAPWWYQRPWLSRWGWSPRRSNQVSITDSTRFCMSSLSAKSFGSRIRWRSQKWLCFFFFFKSIQRQFIKPRHRLTLHASNELKKLKLFPPSYLGIIDLGCIWTNMRAYAY